MTLEDFQGWKKGPGWDDMSFSNEHDRNFEKMAIVGPEQWRDWACAFAGKGFRSVAVEYFLPSQLKGPRTGSQTTLKVAPFCQLDNKFQAAVAAGIPPIE